MEVSGFLRVMAGWTGLDHASDSRRLARLDLETGRPDKTERSEGLAGWTGLEPAASGVTGRRSNQLNYAPLGRSIVA